MIKKHNNPPYEVAVLVHQESNDIYAVHAVYGCCRSSSSVQVSEGLTGVFAGCWHTESRCWITEMAIRMICPNAFGHCMHKSCLL